MTPESVAVDVVAALSHCDRALGDYATTIKLDYDFGPDSELYPHLVFEPQGSGAQADIRKTIRMPISLRPFLSNEIGIQIMLTFTKMSCEVASSVEAHLDRAMAGWEPGVHVLYRKVSEGLRLAELSETVDAHILDLYRLPTFPKSLGIRPRG
ncbi:hypothetical protein [Micromonospora sp. NPDC049274]|uniref:hypothetical protein n=1 Tax=Micromonospora sp. NPDC049274 TaxID=3154829 RepID=UPI0034164D65